MIVWGIATRFWGHYWELHTDQPPILPPVAHNIALFFLYGMAGKYLEDFAIGMLISVCYVLSRNTSGMDRLSQNLHRHSLWLWRAGILWLFFMATWYTYPWLSFLNPFFGVHNWLCELGFALGFGLCVTAVLFGPVQLKQLFNGTPLRWIGQISYSMYIWHLPILIAFMAFVLPLVQGWHSALVYTLYWLYAILVIIPFSYAFYRCIEQPWIKIAHKTRAT